MENSNIALLIMLKNEELRLHVTLESVLGVVDCIIAYDTGSTDNTINILREFCDKNTIPLRLKEGEFVDFSTSRNISLDFADSFDDIYYILLLDANDELIGGDKLREFADNHKSDNSTSYMVFQHWWSGNYTKYYNIRFIKSREGFRYTGSVHEYISKNGEKNCLDSIKMPDDIIIYQDRTSDDNKSIIRLIRDKELLISDYIKNINDTRTLFYLAQTCFCLNHLEDAFYYYKLRSELDGFLEEKFHSYLRCGEISELLKYDWYNSLKYYMKSLEIYTRVEPLIKIAEYYKKNKLWTLSFTFINLACLLNYPTDHVLFIDNNSYEYNRWEILKEVSYYKKYYEEVF